eukprot:3328427-Prymnesium_polylepis.1
MPVLEDDQVSGHQGHPHGALCCSLTDRGGTQGIVHAVWNPYGSQRTLPPPDRGASGTLAFGAQATHHDSPACFRRR